MTEEEMKARIAELEAESSDKDAALESYRKNGDAFSQSLTDLQAKYEKLEAESQAKELASAEKSGDIETVRESLKNKYEADLATEREATASARQKLNDMMTKSDLSAMADRLGVDDRLRKAFDAVVRSEGLEHRDGQTFVGQKTIDEWESVFAKSDEAEVYKSVPTTSGIGADGNGSSENAVAEQKFSMTALHKMYAENPEKAKAWAAANDKADLLKGL